MMSSDSSEGLALGGPWGAGTQSPPALLTEPHCPSLLQLAPGVNSGQGLGVEIIATLQLVLCVLATTDRRRRDLGGSGPLAIGLSVALGHLLAVSGAPSQVWGWGEGRARWELLVRKGPPAGLFPAGNQLGVRSCPGEGSTGMA